LHGKLCGNVPETPHANEKRLSAFALNRLK
jgi:hypothetical protein